MAACSRNQWCATNLGLAAAVPDARGAPLAADVHGGALPVACTLRCGGNGDGEGEGEGGSGGGTGSMQPVTSPPHNGGAITSPYLT